MGFGYLLLAVKSEQDNYLIGNPQFTFFKAVYRKHTNFSMDYQFSNFIGDTTNAFGRKLYIDIPKNGDLLHRMYLTIDITNDTDVDELAPLAYNFIEYIDILIGGQRIDRHYGEWLAIWHELMEDSSKSIALANMVGVQNNNTSGKTLTIPLRFWFNNEIGLALPLIALQYNDIKLEIKFNKRSEVDKFSSVQVAANTNLQITNIQLISEYIHLDKEERRIFSSNNHEYLITQVQSSLNNTINNFSAKYNENKKAFERQRHKIDLRFSYPVKELFWSVQDGIGNATVENTTPEYSNTGIFKYNYWNNYVQGNDQMSVCNLVVNGKELSEELPATFYRDIQQYQYHSGYGTNFIELGSSTPVVDLAKGSGLYSYSFALKPEDFQPSGSLNFSKLENCQLKFGLLKNKYSIVHIINTTSNISAANIGDTVTQGTNVGILRKEITDKQIEVVSDYATTFVTNANIDVGSINTNTTSVTITRTPIGTHLGISKSITVYAVNYNVLRIMSGMAGLAFIN